MAGNFMMTLGRQTAWSLWMSSWTQGLFWVSRVILGREFWINTCHFRGLPRQKYSRKWSYMQKIVLKWQATRWWHLGRDCTIAVVVLQDRGLQVSEFIFGRWLWVSRLLSSDTGREKKWTVTYEVSQTAFYSVELTCEIVSEWQATQWWHWEMHCWFISWSWIRSLHGNTILILYYSSVPYNWARKWSWKKIMYFL